MSDQETQGDPNHWAYAKGWTEALEEAAKLVEDDGGELWWWHLAEKIRGLKQVGA